MADECDQALDTQEFHTNLAILNALRTPTRTPTGFCRNCGVPLHPDKSFCDADCRDDFELRARRY